MTCRADQVKTQSERFVEAAREAGCSEDEAVFDAALRKIVKTKPEKPNSASVEQQQGDAAETKPCP